MKRAPGRVYVWVLPLLLAAAPAQLAAQSGNSQSQAELIQSLLTRIEQLEKRVAELESGGKARPAPTPIPGTASPTTSRPATGGPSPRGSGNRTIASSIFIFRGPPRCSRAFPARRVQSWASGTISRHSRPSRRNTGIRGGPDCGGSTARFCRPASPFEGNERYGAILAFVQSLRDPGGCRPVGGGFSRKIDGRLPGEKGYPLH